MQARRRGAGGGAVKQREYLGRMVMSVALPKCARYGLRSGHWCLEVRLFKLSRTMGGNVA